MYLMSDERDRRIRELESLVAGQAAEIDRLNKELDKSQSAAIKLIRALESCKKMLGRGR